jgi:ribosomal protein S18 acetylase RimI-like enzyme
VRAPREELAVTDGAGPGAGVAVRAVSGRRDLRRFIDLPYRLHANRPQWVPPLRLERWAFLSRRLNPFFEHGEAQYFLALRSGPGGTERVIGRISAHIDHAYNEFHKSRWGWFGFLEAEPDQAVFEALLDAAARWLAERGCERMVGPADFALNDECGILIEGFDERTLIREPWQPPYYRELIEAAGLAKAKDVYFWCVHADDRHHTLPVIFELAEKAQAQHGIRVRRMSRLHLRRELDHFAEIYNEAWSKNWGFVPYSKKDLDFLAQDFQLIFDREWMMVAEREDTGEVVGMAITLRDVNGLYRKMNGRLLPLGWWHYLRKRRHMTSIRIGWLGVKPAYQHTGIAAKLFVEHFETAVRTGVPDGHTGWTLEDNAAINAGMEAMGLKVCKVYRIYEQLLAPAAVPAGPAGAGS